MRQFNILCDSKIKLQQSTILPENKDVLLNPDKEAKGKIITNENDEKIDVVFSSYTKYFGQYYGACFFICAFCAMLIFLFSKIVNDYVIGIWAYNKDGDQDTRYAFYASICFGLTFLTTLGAYARSGAC